MENFAERTFHDVTTKSVHWWECRNKRNKIDFFNISRLELHHWFQQIFSKLLNDH